MTKFINGQKTGGLERVKPDMAKIFPAANSPAYDEYESQQAAERNRKEKQQAHKNQQYEIFRLGGLKAYNNFTLEKFTNKAAIELCAEFPGNNLYLWGTAGTGKTHLATALVRQYAGAQVLKPQHIYRACRGLKDGNEEQAAINSFRDMPYFVIDDAGAEKKTDFSFSTLLEIIDGRDMYEMKGMIITSNLSLGDLAARLDDDRIISRINGMCDIIQLTGKDGRDK